MAYIKIKQIVKCLTKLEEIDKEKPVGYQIEAVGSDHEIPDGFPSFAILNKKAVANFFEGMCKGEAAQWEIVPIFEGDIEEPTFIKE